MPDPMAVTSRIALRAQCGYNSHFCWDPSNYSKNGVINDTVLQAAIQLGAGLCRERWFPGDKQQQYAFTEMGKGGVRLFTTMADMTSKTADIADILGRLAKAPILPYVQAITGPNEMNASQSQTWVQRAMSIQQDLYTAARSIPALSNVAVVSGSLKHNVKNYDGDLGRLGEAGYSKWCDVADMHYYPGRAGPITNKSERDRVRTCFSTLDTYHSETGWTEADTSQEQSGPMTVEAYLRGYLDPSVVGTFIYELVDEAPITQGREGRFGMLDRNGQPKLAYSMAQELLRAREEPEEPFPGWMVKIADEQPTVVDYVVTSEGDGRWTIYLLRSSSPTASAQVSIVLPRSTGYALDVGDMTTGSAGNRRYTVPLTDSMTIAHVAPQE